MSNTILTATVFGRSSVWLGLRYTAGARRTAKTLTYSWRFDLWSWMASLMYTVVSWLDDQGNASVCICDWSHMFNSRWTTPANSPVYWLETDTFKGFIHATLREVNSIAGHHGFGHSPSRPGWFLHVGRLPLSAFSLHRSHSVPQRSATYSSGSSTCPEGRSSWFYFIQCEFNTLLIGICYTPNVRFHMLLLGILPSVSVHMCVWPAICSSWCGFTTCLSSILPTHLTHTHTSSHTHTLAHTLLGAEGAPFITVTFSFNTQPKSSCVHIHVSCAPCWGTIPTT